MPQYYSEPWEEKNLDIIVTPQDEKKSKKAKWFWVGEKVNFIVEIVNLSDDPKNLDSLGIWEQLPGRIPSRNGANLLKIGNRKKGEAESKYVIGREGSIEFRLVKRGDYNTGKTIVSGNALNPDRTKYEKQQKIRYITIGVILTTIFGTIVTLLLNWIVI